MSVTSSLRPGEPDGPRSLRDRVFDVFRTPPQAGLGITTAPSYSGPMDNRTHSEPDVTTGLLESYNQVDPVCGERRCSHGTFSPQIEDTGRASYMGSFDGFGSNRHGVSAGATGFPRRIDELPESGAGSETPSQLKTSSLLSSNDTRKK
jgi:hypothetical protein